MLYTELRPRNVYEDLDPGADAYFFKVGDQGVVIFHGRNYNLKKRLTDEEQRTLLHHPSFFRITCHLFVNVDKITEIDHNTLHFRDAIHGVKSIEVPRKMAEQLRRLIHTRNSIAI
ncbi:DNA-binding LytR/AlgR family response regulator [Paenibacillus shirakamiensis]|uniref:DNA-binding LytR/AlgR family response regulator n=1 Tax=Paenibacillus shirakamiensis TaxID=1265935 RepID=A0ABS4JHL2_9BACL|nr:LytTR family transcriptional regulator DNA-binding domain-containing protein [Paenibacillus shirakamiensis]MBP2001213.1 DNA-binding LytR/AlgR family response regulator [Paenibacillus shirakamiensis]